MNDLDTIIRGHIFEIKEHIEDIFALEEYFGFTAEDLEQAAEELKKSVENGVLEHKNRTLTSVFSFLEGLKYDAKGFDRLESFIQPLTRLVYIILAQRLIAKGTLRISGIKGEDREESGIEEKDLSIKEILADVQLRIKNNPETGNDQRIKSILLQVRQYRTELEKKQNLKPNILPEKREAFEANYRKIFEQLFKKIRETYYSILASEDETRNQPERQKQLTDYDLHPAVSVYNRQFEAYSSLRSTLLYAVRERYNLREIFTDLDRKKDAYFNLLEEEYKKMQLVAPFEGEARQLVHLFTSTLIRTIERHASLMRSGL